TTEEARNIYKQSDLEYEEQKQLTLF
ncbi:hypothetical protein G5584_14855, partial [Staphylococcus aureus]|nr:hypothetical protein [Staphylococcus aureus]